MMTKPADLINATVRVTRIRAVNKMGCIAFGHRVDLDFGINDRSSAIVIKAPAGIIEPSAIAVGGIYDIYGSVERVVREHESFVATELQIDVQDIRLVRPSGSQVIQWLSDNVRGIGQVKATKLYDLLGERLYSALDNADHDIIREVVASEEVRSTLFQRWLEDGDAATLKFVQEQDIPLDLARKVIKFHRKDTISALRADPYRMLSFEGSWKRVDGIARDRFLVSIDDHRRLTAAIEEALYRVSEQGHTCESLDGIYAAVSKLILPHRASKDTFKELLLQGKAAGQLVTHEYKGSLMLHTPGVYIMERECAEFIAALLSPGRQQQLLQINIDAVIAEFEAQERHQLGIDDFSLNAAQRAAVKTSFDNRFSIITGGAGVGKTTVLKALYRALDTLGKPRFQMALAGRAAARMVEATHEPASTIAAFLRNVSEQEMGPGPVLVIDEASMLDLTTFHRIIRKIPEDTHLILVGDPYQLPPIGAGLILHLLCNVPAIPSTELTVVKRQAANSNIPVVSKTIREGAWPNLSQAINDEVVFLPCSDPEIMPTVMRLYDDLREDSQILCATKGCRFSGVNEINRLCQRRYTAANRPLLLTNEETDEIEDTGFRVGDLLLFTRNDWQRNLQNGSLGELTDVFDSREVNIGCERKPIYRSAIGRACYEGVDHYVLETDVDYLDHAYAITVHKAQGSQFKRVIVPVRKSRMIDRTFIYTAITRAQTQVILVGDEYAAREAVQAPPRAFKRQVGLRLLLQAS
ncbi:MAG: AAA family ATPase [Pseudohongiella nitratireducens]|nr:AAA family ATPase [Pseudohongiella nitratireducens]